MYEPDDRIITGSVDKTCKGNFYFSFTSNPTPSKSTNYDIFVSSLDAGQKEMLAYVQAFVSDNFGSYWGRNGRFRWSNGKNQGFQPTRRKFN